MNGDMISNLIDRLEGLEAKINELLEETKKKEIKIKQLEKEIESYSEIKPGVVLHGFCNGFFGRDSYGDKVIEAIGPDWVVAREEHEEEPLFASFHGWANMHEYLIDWTKPEWVQRP
jgi:hypothetical protein